MSKWNPNFLAALWQQSANSSLSAGTVKLAALDAAYTPSDAHEFLSDVSASVLGTAVTLTSKTFTNGVFNAQSPDYEGADLDGESVGFFQIYIDTGSAATSRLVYLFNGNEAQLPFTGEGVDQPIVLPNMPLCDVSGSEDNVYPLFAQALFEQPANSNVSSGTLKVIGIDGDYTFDAADDFLNDVPSGQRTGTAQTIGSKTYTAGLLGGADVTFTGGLTDCRGFLYYLDTGDETTSRVVGVKRDVQALPGGGLTTAADQPLHHTNGIFRLGAEF